MKLLVRNKLDEEYNNGWARGFYFGCVLAGIPLVVLLAAVVTHG